MLYYSKTEIVSAAETKVNEVKTAVITQIDVVITGCSRRLLREIEVNQDGSQRMLTEGLKFGDLATSIQVIDGVVSFHIVLILINTASNMPLVS